MLGMFLCLYILTTKCSLLGLAHLARGWGVWGRCKVLFVEQTKKVNYQKWKEK